MLVIGFIFGLVLGALLMKIPYDEQVEEVKKKLYEIDKLRNQNLDLTKQNFNQEKLLNQYHERNAKLVMERSKKNV